MAKKQTSAPATETLTETLNIDGDEITVVRTVPAKKGRKAVRGRAAKEAPDAATAAPTSTQAPQGDPVAEAESARDTGADDAPSAKPRRATMSKRTPATAKAGTGSTATKGKRPAKTSPSLPFGDLAERFLQHLEAIGKSRATVFSYSIDLGVATRAFGAETDAGTITEAQVAEFFGSDRVTKTRTGKSKSNLTIDKTRRVARQVFAWAATEGMISTSPIPADAVPTGKRKAKGAGSEETVAA
ncbi:MAG: hypothetical protein H6674_10870 [Dehalococcoidia bacterium]|nr:hypothetical protein [Dehalococcoidia bacterium]